jgi:hypothetical protein
VKGKRNVKRGIKATCVCSKENPFTTSLDELIEHYTNVVKRESAYVKAKEFSRVASAEFQSYKRLRRVFQARIFNLLGDLV